MEHKNQTRAIIMLSLVNAAKAMDTYVRALGAVETSRTMCPLSHKLVHGSLKIGQSELFFGEHNPGMKDEKGNQACFNSAGQNIYVYVPDAEAAMKMAVEGGMTEAQGVQDMFWGDRMGTVTDEFGLRWNLATHIRDVSPEEMTESLKKMGETRTA